MHLYVCPDAMSVLVRLVIGLVEFSLVPRAAVLPSECLAMHYTEMTSWVSRELRKTSPPVSTLCFRRHRLCTRVPVACLCSRYRRRSSAVSTAEELLSFCTHFVSLHGIHSNMKRVYIPFASPTTASLPRFPCCINSTITIARDVVRLSLRFIPIFAFP
jgi:hypothetical protein